MFKIKEHVHDTLKLAEWKMKFSGQENKLKRLNKEI
jgi:hypothetical protein